MRKSPNQRLDMQLQCLLEDVVDFFAHKASEKETSRVPNRSYFELVTRREQQAAALVRDGHVLVIDEDVGRARVCRIHWCRPCVQHQYVRVSFILIAQTYIIGAKERLPWSRRAGRQQLLSVHVGGWRMLRLPFRPPALQACTRSRARPWWLGAIWLVSHESDSGARGGRGCCRC